MKKVPAKFISVIFGPQTWLPVLFLTFVFKTGLSFHQIKILLPSILIFQVIIPLMYIYIAYRKRWISDLDLTKKSQRLVPLVVSLISLSVLLMIAYIFANKLVFNLYLLFYILLIVNAIVTLFWKISFHMAVTTAGSLLVNFLFNWQLPWLYLSIPLVYAARLALKKHSPAQLMVAFLLNGGIIIYYLKQLGYLP